MESNFPMTRVLFTQKPQDYKQEIAEVELELDMLIADCLQGRERRNAEEAKQIVVADALSATTTVLITGPSVLVPATTRSLFVPFQPQQPQGANFAQPLVQCVSASKKMSQRKMRIDFLLN